MPIVKEAALAVAGRIINVDEVRDRDGKFTGMRCLVKSGDGFTQTRLNPEASAYVKPTEGASVVWYVRPGAMLNEEGGIIFYTSFVREATADDVDLIVSSSSLSA